MELDNRCLPKNLLLREIHGISNRTHQDLDAKITKELHKGRAIAGPNTVIKRLPCSQRGRIGLKKLSGTEKTNGIHTWISSNELLGMSHRRLYYQSKAAGGSKRRITFAEIDSKGELAYCFDVKSTRGLAKEMDTYFPPQTPACEPCYDDIDGPLRSWEPAIMRIPNSTTPTLEVFGVEDGKNIAEISYKDLCPSAGRIDMTSAPFSNVTYDYNGDVILTLAKTSLPKDVLSDFFVLKHPPTRISHRIQIMQSAKKGKEGKRMLESIEVLGDFLIGIGVGLEQQDIMHYDLEKLLEQNAEFLPLGLSDWSIKTYIIRELPQPIFTVTACKSFAMFNPGGMPAYYVVRSPDGFQVYEAALTEKKFIYEIKLLSDMEDKVDVAFMSSDAEPRIAILEAHTFRIFAIRRQESGTSTCDLVFSKDFNLDDQSAAVENTEHRGSRRSLRNPQKKRVYYQEYFGLGWDENPLLKQFVLVKFTDATVTCHFYDSIHFKLLYSIEPHFFSPGDNVDLRGATVSYNDNNIFVKIKCDSKLNIFVINLVGEVQVAEVYPLKKKEKREKKNYAPRRTKN